jgi:hypothetical protein
MTAHIGINKEGRGAPLIFNYVRRALISIIKLNPVIYNTESTILIPPDGGGCKEEANLKLNDLA